ncbi:putative nuclear RNA export factor SDE5 isoform X4 [Senna tora]|uniref:Putative nuclear RNA export factor SDE5 isoform X4 n=1 Tax=Senna tora TaxID=362788 RepID=A0A834TKX8_9FABA|nr:putative nuclear RNA export factor SDE5 isoform X4 [Senna tora]
MQANSDIQESDLNVLLDMFGSAFSLEDIASAYSQARRNVNLTAEILCASHETVVDLASSSSNDKLKGGTVVKPADLSSAYKSPKCFIEQSESRAGKSKVRPASLGTVSGIVGRDYIQPKTLTKRYPEVNKPLKLDANELPASEIWCEKPSPSDTVAKGTISDDVVNFLFKMLGDGFQLDKTKIHEILGHCGYDVQKTMEKLLDMSASTLDKCEDVLDLTGKNSKDQYPDVDSASSKEAGTIVCNSTDSPKRDGDRVNLQKEVLTTLFSFPQRYEKIPKPVRPVRASPYGKPVVEPPEDTMKDRQIAVVEPQVIKEEHDDIKDENSYDVLRQAVREYWTTMKVYYKAAIEAFLKGDYARADKFLEQGNFFDRRAREEDEKSAQKLLETKVDDNDMPLDLHENDPESALKLLRLHLTSLSGIPSIKYLRVKVGTRDKDPKGARKKRIIKQLKKDSINWTEEDDGGTLRLQVDVIDPKSLSFYKNK